MKAGDRYKTSSSQEEKEVLDNLMGITDIKEIEKQEAMGFIKANLSLLQSLSSNTQFDVDYILGIHKKAFEHLYPFAGRLRDVDMSKGGFAFPAAMHLQNSMKMFYKDILSKLKNSYSSKEEFIEDVAMVHAELLFIHPFREGNGRTARLLANLMCHKAGYESLAFEKLDNEEMFKKYIVAVQRAGMINYEPMKQLINYLLEP